MGKNWRTLKLAVLTVTIIAIVLFLVAVALGPILPLAAAGWALFFTGLLALVPINRLESLNSRTEHKEGLTEHMGWLKKKTLLFLAFVLMCAGLSAFFLVSLLALPPSLLLVAWGISMLGLSLLMGLIWRHISGY